MYLEFFGLRQKPFSHTPDPRFMYWNDDYREALASLRYGIQERKGFLAMIGEAGTGKTTLLRKLLDELGQDVVSVFLFNPNATFDEILEYTLSELGIAASPGRRLAMLQRLNEFLLAAFAEGRNTILVIDEAQDLDANVLESLRLLSNLEASQEKILQIVLSGQPELAQRLAEPGLRQLKQRIAVRCRLEPLKRSELKDYIEARLGVAGASEEIFQFDSLEPIWNFSGGIPRLINTVSDNALLLGYALGKKRIDAAIVGEVITDLRQLDIGVDVPVGPTPAGAATQTAMAAPLSSAPAAPAEGASPETPGQHDASLSTARPPQKPALATPVAQAKSDPVPPHRQSAEDTDNTAAAAVDDQRGRSRALAAFAVIGLLAVIGMATAAWLSGAAVGQRHLPFQNSFGDEIEESAPKPATDRAIVVEEQPNPPQPSSQMSLSHPETTERPAPQKRSGDAGRAPGANAVPNKRAAAPVGESPSEPRLETEAEVASPASDPKEEFATEPTPDARAESTQSEGGPDLSDRLALAARGHLPSAENAKKLRVVDGDTLSNLATSQYGSANYTTLDMLRTVNPGVSDVDLILAGSELVFPDPGPTARILRTDGTVTVLALTTPDVAKAERVRNALKGRLKRKVEMKPVPLAGGAKLYRVWISGLPDEAAATAAATALGTILEDPES